jgi:hypothetical protein
MMKPLITRARWRFVFLGAITGMLLVAMALVGIGWVRSFITPLVVMAAIPFRGAEKSARHRGGGADLRQEQEHFLRFPAIIRLDESGVAVRPVQR